MKQTVNPNFLIYFFLRSTLCHLEGQEEEIGYTQEEKKLVQTLLNRFMKNTSDTIN